MPSSKALAITADQTYQTIQSLLNTLKLRARKKKQSSEKEGQKYQKKVVNVIPIDSPIVKGLKKMSETERNGM